MNEFVRDTLPSHEQTRAVVEPPAAEAASGLFERLASSRNLLTAVTAVGALSLFAASESSPSRAETSPPKHRAVRSAVRHHFPIHKFTEQKTVAVLDDSVEQADYPSAYNEMLKIKETGANAVKITASWVTGQTGPSEKDLNGFENAMEAANQLDLKVIVNVAACTHLREDCKDNSPPLTQLERGKFTNWLANLAYNLPDVQDFVIGNENNYGAFWWPQHYGDGSYAAAENYFKLLASSYDVLKKAAANREGGKDITVYGLSLASKGSYPPVKFLQKFRQAYVRSGRKKPVLDVVSYHPYPVNSAEMPGKKHRGWVVGIGDYPELVANLKKTFAGTPQAKKKLLIAYDEYGIQTKIPSRKRDQYQGREQAHTHAVSEAEQAKNLTQALELAACQPLVINFTQFLDTDERNKTRWQSGLRYSDGTAKSSLTKVRPAFENFENGAVICD